MVRIDNFHIVGGLHIGSRDHALGIFAQAQRHFVTVVQLEHHAFEVQQDVDHVFLHAFDRRILVQNTREVHFGGGVTRHRRQEHATQRVTQGVAIAAFKRLQSHLRAVGADLFNVDCFGFQ